MSMTNVGTIVDSLSPPRKRELTPAARDLLHLLTRLFAKRRARSVPVEWHATREWYAEQIRRNVWTVSRAKTELVQAGYVEITQQRKPGLPGPEKWGSSLIRPAARMWPAIRELAHAFIDRVRSFAHNAPDELNPNGIKPEIAPPGDSSRASRVAAKAYDLLVRADFRRKKGG